MACSIRNLLVNGDFREGLSPWTGANIKRVKNPISKNDFAVLMNNPAGSERTVLKQTVSGPFEKGCTYYLHFGVLNITPASGKVTLFATVAYLDANQKIVQSTPLQVLPPKTKSLKWHLFFSIVPPPPVHARFASIVFLLSKGTLFIDYITFAAMVSNPLF